MLAGMAPAFLAKRLELGLPADADTLATASTKDELLEEARAAGIEGAASMTKAELAAGLVETMVGTTR